MQIINNRKIENVPFTSIETGEEFMYSDRLHMRTDSESYNAVDLEDGTLWHLRDDDVVGIVSAIITIQP